MKPTMLWVAVILAASIGIALNLLTVFALYTALRFDDFQPARLVAITQVLTGWGGGIVGVLGAYVGYALKHPSDTSGQIPEDFR